MNMDFGYKDKVCVVTGGSNGIGKAVTELLVSLGAKVYVLDIYECNAPGITQFISCNLSDKNEIDKAFEIIPKEIYSFFGVAGMAGFNTDYITTFNANFTSNKYMVDKYVKWRMKEGASILFVSSTSGSNWIKYKEEQAKYVNCSSWEDMQKILEPLARKSPASFAYMFSKRCLCMYSMQKAIEYSKIGIRVNTILPGSTNTNMREEFQKSQEIIITEADVFEKIADPIEIAYPCIFINSKLASFISGEELRVDYTDGAKKTLNLKKDREDISATNTWVLLKAKQMLNKNTE